MNLTELLNNWQCALNAVAAVACILLCAEYLFIVRIRKSPYPFSSYAVAFVLFALACDRLLKISQPPAISTLWQLGSQCLVDITVLFAALLIPLVRRSAYKRPRFNQLQEIHASLNYSQNLLRSYLDEAPVVAYIKDKDRQVIHTNAGFIKLFGDVESAIGKTNLWGDPDLDRARDLEILSGVGEKEINQTVQLKDGAGSLLDIRFPLSGPASEKMLGGIAIDITNQLKRKNRLEVFASIVELSPDAIYSYNASGTVLTWNPAAEALSGYGQSEMIGQSIQKIVPADKQDELLQMIDELSLNSGNSQHFESVRIAKSGKCIPVLVAAACVNGVEPVIAVISRDITRKQEVEGQIAALHDELDAKLRELSHTNISLQKARDEAIESASTKSAFVANISHELRTPLSGILGLSELLFRQSLDADSHELITMLNESAQELLQVVEDVLDLAKIEAGKTSREEEVFSVRDLIEKCAKLFSATMSSKGLTCKISVDEDVPELIRSDPSIIRQILSNLVVNAVRFTESGVIALSASVVQRSDTRLELKFSVADTGLGIDEEHLSVLFTPFARVSQSTEGVPGTGLGLTLSKQLIDLLDGQMGCSSRKNDGSTFWFTVLVRTAAEDFQAEELTALPTMLPLELQKYRVLSVDDSPVVSRLTIRQLGIIGVQAEAAVTGREAIDKAEKEDFDLILMDVHLPDMTGYEAAQEIRKRQEAEGRLQSIVIALTGFTADTLHEQGDASVMDGYLEKPVTIEQLRSRLIQAFSRRNPGRL